MKKRKADFDLKSKLINPNECWTWSAGRTGGYGVFYIGKVQHYAHSVSYRLFMGGVSKGLELDHTCHNPACFNPLHLEPVTHLINVQRGDANKAKMAKPTCKFEHLYDGHDGRRRTCSICHNRRNTEYKQRKIEASFGPHT